MEGMQSRAEVLNHPNAVVLQYRSSCCGDPANKVSSWLHRDHNFATVTNRNVSMFPDGLR